MKNIIDITNFLDNCLNRSLSYALYEDFYILVNYLYYILKLNKLDYSPYYNECSNINLYRSIGPILKIYNLFKLILITKMPLKRNISLNKFLKKFKFHLSSYALGEIYKN